jgi:hypothetical protein
MSQPFFTALAGTNYHCTDEVPIAVLSRALCRVCSFLQNLAPSAQLRRYEDWWEHDSSHFEGGIIDLHSLFKLVESPRALLTAMQGDEFVFVGIAPEDATWYLRFYVYWDDEGWELLGRFDITLPSPIAEDFAATVLGEINIAMEKQDAQAYYKSRMA